MSLPLPWLSAVELVWYAASASAEGDRARRVSDRPSPCSKSFTLCVKYHDADALLAEGLQASELDRHPLASLSQPETVLKWPSTARQFPLAAKISGFGATFPATSAATTNALYISLQVNRVDPTRAALPTHLSTARTDIHPQVASERVASHS